MKYQPKFLSKLKETGKSMYLKAGKNVPTAE